MPGLTRGLRRVGAVDFIPTGYAGETTDVSGLAGRADTGEIVTDATALNVSAFWRGMTLISTGQAMLPLHLYRRVGEGKERAKDLPLYHVLHRRPNPDMSSFTYRQTIASHVVAWGNGFSEKLRGNRDNVTGLYPLRPDRMKVERRARSAEEIARREFPRRRFVYLERDGSTTTFDQDEIHHVRGIGFDGLVGYPVLTVMRNTIALTRTADKAQGAMFGNGARPSVVLRHPGTMPDPARKQLAEDWSDAYAGASNTGKVAVLEDNIAIEQIGFPPVDAQYLQSRAFQVLEFCRWLGLPPHKLYELTRATFSNIEQQALEYLTDSLNGWLVNWEQQMGLDLLADDPDEELFFEFDRNGLMQIDARTRAVYYQTMRWLGVLNGDDIASRENMNPLPDGIGEKYFVPMNMAELTADGMTARPGLAAVPNDGGPALQDEAAMHGGWQTEWEMGDLAVRVEALEREQFAKGDAEPLRSRHNGNGVTP